MSEFETTLRGEVDKTVRNLATARAVGMEHEIQLHIARIRDLLDVAANNDIATADWVDGIDLGAVSVWD
ncbi:MAG: hypothetical protein HOY78_31800 [Saccharothrix sp.]|nr:hypothetical protein [Saccharothrix sp.]